MESGSVETAEAARDAQLYLGSGSPRRQALLNQLGLRYAVVVPSIDESRQPGESATALVSRLARAKAADAIERIGGLGYQDRPVLAADTEVVIEEQVLGKPRDLAHAHEILGLLSGRSHEVLTALAFIHEGSIYEAVSCSRVTFRPLSSGEIDAYWATGEPHDKAGAYAIQGMGAIFVCKLEGSYSGVMGLPLYELQQLLVRVGINCL